VNEHDVDIRALSRIGGILYLIIIAGGILGDALIRGTIIVPDDAIATADNLQSMEALWRFGVAAEFVMLLCTTVLALILFILLRPVSRDLALLAVFFNLVTVAVEGFNELRMLGALSPLGGAAYLAAFTPEQLDALASLALESYSDGFGANLVFFGCECVVLGSLIYRSDFLPKAIGILMAIAGSCYLVNSLALLGAPGIAEQIAPSIILAFVGEAALCLWLLFKGVDVPKWRQRASALDENAARSA
jgi:hypothetical protein